MSDRRQKLASSVSGVVTRRNGAGSTADTVRVRVPSEAQAHQLQTAIDGAHPCDVRLDDGGEWNVEIRTEKTGEAVSRLLTRVEESLTASSTPSATVFLDGHQYQLEPHRNGDRAAVVETRERRSSVTASSSVSQQRESQGVGK